MMHILNRKGQKEPIMPSYIFRLEQFHIDNTRAADDDTDIVSFAVKVGDQVLGEPQIKHMGNVDNGDHLVNLEFGPVSVDTPATPVVFNYQILNSGHKDDAFIDTLLKQGADELAHHVSTSGNIWATAGAWALKFFVGLFTVDCDGPVAIDQVAVTGATLETWTAETGKYSEKRFYPGGDTDWGCGSNSEYYVTWSVTRVPSKRIQGSSGFLIQTTYGSKGNFELVVPRITTGLAHYWRNNDDPALPWNGPFDVSTPLGHVDAVSFLQSNFGTPGSGNFELLAWVGDRLISFWRPDAGGADGRPGVWQGPFDLVADGMPMAGVVGNPAFIQGRHGVKGNFELVVPLAIGGLTHYWRDNDDEAGHLPWHQAQNPFPGFAERVDAVSLIESTFSAAGNGPGNLELVARIGDRLALFSRPDTGGSNNTPGNWQGPIFFAAGV
jgi:hypothetical protein